jgi:hypothetical protein
MDDKISWLGGWASHWHPPQSLQLIGGEKYYVHKLCFENVENCTILSYYAASNGNFHTTTCCIITPNSAVHSYLGRKPEIMLVMKMFLR